MPRSHIHGFYYGLNLTDDPGNANFHRPIHMHYIRTIKYYYACLRMQYGKLRINTLCYDWCRIVSVANPASSPWMCNLGIEQYSAFNQNPILLKDQNLKKISTLHHDELVFHNNSLVSDLTSICGCLIAKRFEKRIWIVFFFFFFMCCKKSVIGWKVKHSFNKCFLVLPICTNIVNRARFGDSYKVRWLRVKPENVYTILKICSRISSFPVISLILSWDNHKVGRKQMNTKKKKKQYWPSAISHVHQARLELTTNILWNIYQSEFLHQFSVNHSQYKNKINDAILAW